MQMFSFTQSEDGIQFKCSITSYRTNLCQHTCLSNTRCIYLDRVHQYHFYPTMSICTSSISLRQLKMRIHLLCPYPMKLSFHHYMTLFGVQSLQCTYPVHHIADITKCWLLGPHNLNIHYFLPLNLYQFPEVLFHIFIKSL